MFAATPAPPYTVVLGLGRSGVGAARLLHQQGERVLVLESGSAESLQQKAQALQDEGIAVQLGVPLQADTIEQLPAAPSRVIVLSLIHI